MIKKITIKPFMQGEYEVFTNGKSIGRISKVDRKVGWQIQVGNMPLYNFKKFADAKAKAIKQAQLY